VREVEKMVKPKLNIHDENAQLKIDAAARRLAQHGDKPTPKLTEYHWCEAHLQRFLRSRWYREGRTFEWWLKRRRKLRRITKQQQRKAAL
jgi:hypothetical protein